MSPTATPKRNGTGHRRRWIAAVVGVVLVVVAVVVLVRALGPGPRTELRLDQFRDRVAAGAVDTAVVANRSSVVTGRLEGGERYRTAFPQDYGERLTQELLDADVAVSTRSGERPTWLTFLLGPVPPTLLIVGVFVWFLMQVQGGGKASRFARTRARRTPGEDRVTFADVAGADEAVEELRDVVEFLRDPDRFSRLGARVPKGVLLVGPPGTGKTLLARAVAGEAGVPFFSISGSDFVEMFVGIGASRVRDLFKQAHAEAPAIVFIDEIDAVGRQRGAGLGGGHDEREQTLNQLLVQMDGFDASEGVVLVAATNRADILDPALLRPGRFDRRVVVDAPDVAGRRAILEVHGRNKPLGADVDLAVLARRTPGFTGADLANVLNEAALLAARRGAEQVHDADVRDAVDRVLAGPERRSRVMSERERRTVAVHEAGHALVSHALPGADPVHKISIVARGASLGHTVLLPEEDRSLHTREELTDRLAVTLGGRSAEEVVLGEVTTGAADDIDRATRLARAMVTEYGMSDKLGPRRLAAGDGEPFLGRDAARDGSHSEELTARVDEEVARLIDEAHERARGVVERHRDTLDRLAGALLERETLTDHELDRLLAPATTVPTGGNRTP